MISAGSVSDIHYASIDTVLGLVMSSSQAQIQTYLKLIRAHSHRPRYTECPGPASACSGLCSGVIQVLDICSDHVVSSLLSRQLESPPMEGSSEGLTLL